MLDIKWNTSATDIHNYVNTNKSRTSTRSDRSGRRRHNVYICIFVIEYC